MCVLRNPHRPQRYTLFEDARPVLDDEEMAALVRDQPLGPIPILAPPAEIERSPIFTGFEEDVKVLSYRPGACCTSTATSCTVRHSMLRRSRMNR